MRNFVFNFKLLLYKQKPQKAFFAMMGCTLFIILYQFLAIKEFAEIGDVTTSFFLLSKDNILQQLFLYTLPLFCALLYGSIYIEARDMLRYIEIRNSTKSLRIAHCLISFIFGFSCCFLFLTIVFLATLFITHSDTTIFYKSVTYTLYHSTALYNDALTMPDLYVNQPFLRIFIYVLLYSIYAGTCTYLTYVISLFAKNKVLVYTLPFLITIFIQVLCSSIQFYFYPQAFLDMRAAFGTTQAFLYYCGIYFLLVNSALSLVVAFYEWRVQHYGIY